jgi:hypothetical protein
MTKKIIILLITLFSVLFLFSEIENRNSQSIIEVKAMSAEDFPINI